MKNIIISGASGGIGFEIAKQLANDNNHLFLIYNQNKISLTQFENEHLQNCSIDIFKCDLTNEQEVNALISSIIKQYNKIDCLINCAGVSQNKQIQDVSKSDFDYIFDNNVRSVVNLTKSVCKHMISEKFGRIVNISSVWGVVGASTESLYSASKSAINGLTLSLAKELGPSGITVNAICPGFIATKMNSQYSTEDIAQIAEETPLQRIGQPEDISGLVEFLISDKASFITGQIIRADGGWTL